MGLDQYCFAHLRDECVQGEDGYFQPKPDDQRTAKVEELGYWRKHPNLQGLMEEIYQRRGGKDTFNCVALELRAEDIDYVVRVVNGEALPQTSGFFFGEDSDEYYKAQDLEIMAKASKALEEGKIPFYYSWW